MPTPAAPLCSDARGRAGALCSDASGRADAANAVLLEHGLVVREMGGYKLPDCLRIGIGLEEDMRRLVDVLGEFMAP